MSRPRPKILLENITEEHKATQVCAADAVYSVCYRGQPVMLRTIDNIEIGYPGPKYLKTNFPSPGHAFNLADKLNKMFNTEDFAVFIMRPARMLKENT
jgi:hypothetical protein